MKKGIRPVFFLVFLLAILLNVPGSFASEGLPPLPASYYGTVTIDGSAAPANTLLTAKIGDEDRGDILTSRGEYGIENNIRLSVEGNASDAGKTVYFYVGTLRANENVQWGSGVVEELALTFTTPPGDDGDDDGGGGGGGGGGGTPKTVKDETPQLNETVTDVPPEEPIKEESVIPATVEENQEAVFEFKESKVSNVEILFSEDVENPSLTIEISDDKPADAIEISEGIIVYKYLTIEKNFDSSIIQGATIHFKVETSWLAENNIYPEDVVLLHFDGGVWDELVTGLDGKVAGFYTFNAQTDDLSSFAIAAKKRKTSSPYVVVVALVLLVIIAAIVLVMLKHHKKVRGSQK